MSLSGELPIRHHSPFVALDSSITVLWSPRASETSPSRKTAALCLEGRYFAWAPRSQGRLPSAPLSQGRAVGAFFSSEAACARSACTRSRSVNGAFGAGGSLCASAGVAMSSDMRRIFFIPGCNTVAAGCLIYSQPFRMKRSVLPGVSLNGG